MIPTDTDRFLASIREAAEIGASIAPYDVLRILRIVEEQGREVLRLRGLPPSSPVPPMGAPAPSLSSAAEGSEGGSADARWLAEKLALEQESGELPPGGASGGAARSSVCPDCRGRGGACLTCAGEGLIGGGR